MFGASSSNCHAQSAPFVPITTKGFSADDFTGSSVTTNIDGITAVTDSAGALYFTYPVKPDGIDFMKIATAPMTLVAGAEYRLSFGLNSGGSSGLHGTVYAGTDPFKFNQTPIADVIAATGPTAMRDFTAPSDGVVTLSIESFDSTAANWNVRVLKIEKLS